MDLFNVDRRVAHSRSLLCVADRAGQLFSIDQDTGLLELGRGLAPSEVAERFYAAFGCDLAIERWSRSQGRVLIAPEVIRARS